MVVASACGAVGVGGLVPCSVLLVWESRLTLAILREETAFGAALLLLMLPLLPRIRQG